MFRGGLAPGGQNTGLELLIRGTARNGYRFQPLRTELRGGRGLGFAGMQRPLFDHEEGIAFLDVRAMQLVSYGLAPDGVRTEGFAKRDLTPHDVGATRPFGCGLSLHDVSAPGLLQPRRHEGQNRLALGGSENQVLLAGMLAPPSHRVTVVVRIGALGTSRRDERALRAAARIAASARQPAENFARFNVSSFISPPSSLSS